MKKFIKILGIISGILAALGIVLIVIGAVNGGKNIVKSDLMNNKLSIDFDHWIDEDFESMSSVNDASITKLEKEQYDIDSLKIEAKYGEVKINQWNEDCFGIENKTKALDTKFEVENGVLRIAVAGEIGIFNDNTGNINIYIPKDMLNSVDLSVGAGELECSGIVTNNLKIDVGAGEGKINYSQIGTCDIDVGLGKLELENTVVESMNVDCGMGEVEAELNNSYNDFDYTLKVGAGEIEIGQQKYAGISNTINLSNNTGKTINVDCGMGEVSIKFTK